MAAATSRYATATATNGAGLRATTGDGNGHWQRATALALATATDNALTKRLHMMGANGTTSNESYPCSEIKSVNGLGLL